MKYIAVIYLITILASCNSIKYLDRDNNHVNTKYVKLHTAEAYNEFSYTNNVSAKKDTEVYIPTHFSIKLPRNIVNWSIQDNNFYFEYNSGQLIYINSSYKNIGKESPNWTETQLTNLGEYKDKISSYWRDENSKKGRINILYTNGKYSIIIFNTTKKNAPDFLKLVKTFTVIE